MDRKRPVNLWRGLTAVALACMVLALLAPSRASAYSSAPLAFCNKSPVKVGVAVGYHSPGVNDPADHSVLTGPFVSQGWVNVLPGQCHTFSNPFSARYMFWYAFSPQFNANGGEVLAMRGAGTPDSFCISNYFAATAVGFTYEDENVSMAACDRASGSQPPGQGKTLWVNPRHVDTWVNPSVDFNNE